MRRFARPITVAVLVLGLALALAWNLAATPGGPAEIGAMAAPAGVVLLGALLALLVFALGRASLDARRRADAAERARTTLGLEVLERLRAEQQARESESRWRAVWEASPIGIFIADGDGQCRFTNPGYQRLSGLSAEDALGDGWARALHPDDRERVVAEWLACARAHRRFLAAARFRHADGAIVHVDVRALGPSDGVDGVGYVGFVEDVTEQHDANALRDARSPRARDAAHRELPRYPGAAARDERYRQPVAAGYAESSWMPGRPRISSTASCAAHGGCPSW